MLLPTRLLRAEALHPPRRPRSAAAAAAADWQVLLFPLLVSSRSRSVLPLLRTPLLHLLLLLPLLHLPPQQTRTTPRSPSRARFEVRWLALARSLSRLPRVRVLRASVARFVRGSGRMSLTLNHVLFPRITGNQSSRTSQSRRVNANSRTELSALSTRRPVLASSGPIVI